jgi:signal transduction histidine kinase/CheY-like chemotaxis protein
VAGQSESEVRLWARPEDQAKLLAQLWEHGSVRHFEAELRTREGAARFCHLFGETFHFGSEEVVLLAALDMSEQRKLEQQLRQAQKLEAVGQLAAGVAHDFNNILTVIQGHVSMQLAATSLEKSLAGSLRQVSDAAERAAALTRQLLAFSRKQVVQRKAVNLNRVVENLEEMLRRLIGSHIDLQCVYAPKLPEVCADEANLEQILMNVVVNARDAMPGGGAIHIATACEHVGADHRMTHPSARAGDFVRLIVSDTGCGMSEETLGHIFEPFFTTKDVGKGTGLGLATVYGIVAQHDGWVEASSEVGKGTTFRIYLPATDLAAEAPPTAAASGDVRGGQETIMLVEDEPDVREVISDILLHHGYRVLTGGDGPEALAVWAEHKNEVDLLITDIVMPNGMKGNVLAEKLRAEKPHLKVIFSSGYSPDFANESSPLSGDAAFLQKPYKLEGLLKLVRECLDRRRAA